MEYKSFFVGGVWSFIVVVLHYVGNLPCSSIVVPWSIWVKTPTSKTTCSPWFHLKWKVLTPLGARKVLQFLRTSRRTTYLMCRYSALPIFVIRVSSGGAHGVFRGTQVATHTPYICKSYINHYIIIKSLQIVIFFFHIIRSHLSSSAHKLLQNPNLIIYSLH